MGEKRQLDAQDRRWVRPRICAACGFAAFVTAGALALGAGGPALADSGTVSPGQGSATSILAQVLPKQGSLAVGVAEGEALAGHQNLQAKAQSQVTDLTSIGTSLTGENCGQAGAFKPEQLPQPLSVETGDPGAASGVNEPDAGGAANRFAQATAAPYAEADTTLAPLAIPGGLINLGGGRAKSYSGIVNGQRVAGATVDLSPITLPGGVTISGMHWEVAYPSTGSAHPSGSFSYGSVSVNGAPLVPAGILDPAVVTTALNGVLGVFGIVITPPTTHIDNGIIYIDPIQISVVPNPARDTLSNGLLGGLSPVLTPTRMAVLNAVCQSDSAFTIGDVAIGSLTGGGSFNLLLGGANATSGELAANTYNLSLPSFGGGNLNSPAASPGLATSTPGSTSPIVSSTSGGTAGTSGTAAPSTPAGDTGSALAPTAGTSAAPSSSPAPPTATSPTRQAAAISHPKTVGDALLGVGLGGLGLLGLLAEGDRRMMRRAQRSTVDFEE